MRAATYSAPNQGIPQSQRNATFCPDPCSPPCPPLWPAAIRVSGVEPHLARTLLGCGQRSALGGQRGHVLGGERAAVRHRKQALAEGARAAARRAAAPPAHLRAARLQGT